MNIRLFLTLLVFASPIPAAALDRTETHALIREDAPDAIEAAFIAHQSSFEAGEIGPQAYLAPYSEFWTNHPEVEAGIVRWRTAYPDSPQAIYAEAARLSHIAHLIRGGDFALRVPTGALDEFTRLSTEAHTLISAVLEATPRHLAAGHALMNIGAFLGSIEERDRGFLIVAELDRPSNVPLSGLRFNYERWGGGLESIQRFCAEWAPAVPDISEEECLAKATYDHALWNPAGVDEAIDILSKGKIEYFLEQHIGALSRAGRLEEAYALAKSRGFMNHMLAYALANGLRDFGIVDEFVARNLEFDPLNPIDLMSYASARTIFGDTEGAWAAVEKAMIYGRYSRPVRWHRIGLMRQDPQMRFDVFDEIVSAVAATDGNMDILGNVMIELMHPPVNFLTREDGSAREDFTCKRLKLFELHQSQCESGSAHHSCEPGMTVRRDTHMIEARAVNACEGDTGPKWQDVVRYLLELTEER